MKYKKTTLPNGLRVITIPTKGNPSVTVLVMVETGSNYETKAENGLSHFLEHMCFKGTKRRPSSSDISRELDGLGAEHNAFTSHEMTGYHAKAEKKQFRKILDVVADMYIDPLLPSADIEKERGVIIQEIKMRGDEPRRQVWNIFTSLMYGDVPAGRTVLGPISNISKFSRKDFVAFRNAHYVAGKTIVMVAGDLSQGYVVTEVKKAFKTIKQGKKLSKPKVVEKQRYPALKVLKKPSEQTHMIFGFRGLKASDPKVPVTLLLATILGQGMSSRLHRRLRDEMGACYYSFAFSDEATDHGFFGIATGVEAKRVDEVTKAVLHECQKLKKELVPMEELAKAQEYSVGRIFMGLETTDDLAEFYAEQEVTIGKPETPFDLEKKLRAVTAKDIQKIAKEIFQNKNLNLAIVGDVKSPARLKKLLVL